MTIELSAAAERGLLELAQRRPWTQDDKAMWELWRRGLVLQQMNTMRPTATGLKIADDLLERERGDNAA